MTYCRKLIEGSLPLEAIHVESAGEKSRFFEREEILRTQDRWGREGLTDQDFLHQGG
jgi:hypothetical protein